VVCRFDDNRSFQQIEEEIKNRKTLTKLEKIENEPEESFDSAAIHTRNQVCPIWLGISRDIRIFELGSSLEMENIIPRMASSSINLPETDNTGVVYNYMAGRGQGVEKNTVRRLEEAFYQSFTRHRQMMISNTKSPPLLLLNHLRLIKIHALEQIF